MFIHDYVLADHRKEYLTTTELNLQSYRSIKKKKKRAHFTSDIANYILVSAQGHEGRHLVHYHCTASQEHAAERRPAGRAGERHRKGGHGLPPAAGRPAQWEERQSETLDRVMRRMLEHHLFHAMPQPLKLSSSVKHPPYSY